MLTALGIVVLVVGLLISIGLHEFGHMIPAKRFGVRVSEYFVGFGPTLFSRKRGETEYGFKAIPLGGYVRIVGMVPPAEEVKPVRLRGWVASVIEDARHSAMAEVREGEQSRAFYRLSWWRKVIVMAGGPVVNLVLAVLLFTVVLAGIGIPSQTLTVRELSECVPAPASSECAPGDPVAPASAAGLLPGDTFTAVDGMPVTTWKELTDYVSARPDQTMQFEVLRDGQAVTLTLTPATWMRQVYDDAGAPVMNAAGDPVTEVVGFMGVYSKTERARQGAFSGIVMAGTYAKSTVNVVAHLPQNVYHVARASLGLEERNTQSVMGVVGMGRAAGDIASADVAGYGPLEKFADMLMLLGALNLALFVFNMIPLVPLDGGHIASALWQAVKNGVARLRRLPHPRPVDVARMMPIAYGVFGVLILMALVLVYADIVAPVNLT